MCKSIEFTEEEKSLLQQKGYQIQGQMAQSLKLEFIIEKINDNEFYVAKLLGDSYYDAGTISSLENL